MKQIDFLQPRHSYAAKEGKGHVYSNTSLWTAVSRVMEAGVDVGQVHDENIRPFTPQAEIVGINALGSPYIPILRKKIHATQNDVRTILGGQVMEGFVQKNQKNEIVDRSEFERLFGTHTVFGNDDAELAAALGIDKRALPPPESTSLKPAYQRISAEDMREYIAGEMSFYLSQGCGEHCDFCAAVRTIADPLTGELRKVKEAYRTSEVLEKDLLYLAEQAVQFGIPRLELYLSNLDVFQTPPKLREFMQIAKRVRETIRMQQPDFQIRMRALSTVASFIKTHEKWPDIIREAVEAGLHMVGFGVDGWNEKLWASISKGHNSKNKSVEAIRLCAEEYGIKPEILMVFGHREDTPTTIEAAYGITEEMSRKYGAIPRPHVAKDLVPGNSYWKQTDPDTIRRKERLFQHPEDFQCNDFTSLASEVSHEDAVIRDVVNEFYLKMVTLPGNTTRPIKNVSSYNDEATNKQNSDDNEGQFDR